MSALDDLKAALKAVFQSKPATEDIAATGMASAIADYVAPGGAGHARQHAITSTADHTSTATPGRLLKADTNGLPINATNTDAQVSAVVTASGTHALDSAVVHKAGVETITGAKTFDNDTTTEPLVISSAHVLGTGMVIDTKTANANGALAFERNSVRQANIAIGNAEGMGANTLFIASGDLTTNWIVFPAGVLTALLGMALRKNDPNCLLLFQPQGGIGGHEWGLGAIRSGVGQLGDTGAFVLYDITASALRMSLTSTGQLVLPGYTDQGSLRVGSAEVQSYGAGVNNCWYGDNWLYNLGHKRRSAGYAFSLYSLAGDVTLRVADTGAAGSTIAGDGTVGWKVDKDGKAYFPQHASVSVLGTNSDGKLVAGSDTGSSLLARMRFGVELLGARNQVNVVFTIPGGEKAVSGTLQVYFNGQCMCGGTGNDYSVSESGGPGTGIDTITFLDPALAPYSGEHVLVDFVALT
jgi:hypothetical protein